jgi:hypothetical protein
MPDVARVEVDRVLMALGREPEEARDTGAPSWWIDEEEAWDSSMSAMMTQTSISTRARRG